MRTKIQSKLDRPQWLVAVWEFHAQERLAGDLQHLKNVRTKYSGLTIHSEFVSVSVFALWPLKYAENLYCVILGGSEQKKKGGRNADSLHTARSASARGYVTMWTNYKRATRYGTRSPVVDEDRGRLAWQRLLKPFAVVVACNWVAFIATNEVLSYCSLCQLWILANFGCCCCRFSSFSLRPSIDVAPDGHVGRWTSSPLLHAVEAPGTFLWHFLGTSGIYVNADQITKWSMMIRARTSASSSAMHEGVFSRLWWKSSVSGARGHRRLCQFSCSVKVNFNRHNLAKLRKKKRAIIFTNPQWDKDWVGNLWMTIDQFAPSAGY